mmetsp:Transcript_22392/g.58357  ORF Transcript_22392/g.58357 Transcript_22392/m.58357 type:complete len:248 (+) Transcript_22392:786-1529(+)
MSPTCWNSDFKHSSARRVYASSITFRLFDDQVSTSITFPAPPSITVSASMLPYFRALMRFSARHRWTHRLTDNFSSAASSSPSGGYGSMARYAVLAFALRARSSANASALSTTSPNVIRSLRPLSVAQTLTIAALKSTTIALNPAAASPCAVGGLSGGFGTHTASRKSDFVPPRTVPVALSINGSDTSRIGSVATFSLSAPTGSSPTAPLPPPAVPQSLPNTFWITRIHTFSYAFFDLATDAFRRPA